MGLQKAAEEMGGSTFEMEWLEGAWLGETGLDEAGLEEAWV